MLTGTNSVACVFCFSERPVKAIDADDRLVRNIYDDEFEPFVWEGKEHAGQSVMQLDASMPCGTGFHIYRMAPGAITTPHEHTSDEHFFLIEGDAVDHDGHEYKPGDIVLLKKGTVHNTRTRNGCTFVVYLTSAESSV